MNIKTNLNRTIKTIDDAKAYIKELYDNNELYHLEDDAKDIIWNKGIEPPYEVLDNVNELTLDCFKLLDFDPMEYCNELVLSVLLFFKKITLKDKSELEGNFRIHFSLGNTIASVEYSGKDITNALDKQSYMYLEMKLQEHLIERSIDNGCGHDNSIQYNENSEADKGLYL
jgi:hypothetical protein